MSNLISALGEAEIAVPAGESIAVATTGKSSVYRIVGYPNFPSTKTLLGVVDNELTIFGPYASGATIVVDAGNYPAYYVVGSVPRVIELYQSQLQNDAVALNSTGAITVAGMVNGLITSTTVAAVDGTLPTGAVIDASNELNIGDSFDWSVVNTGANTFTILADTGHTIVGEAAVATATSGLFRTRKTAADTFVTYRLA